MNIKPQRIETTLRRSPLYRWHMARGAQMRGQLVDSYPHAVTDSSLGVCDLNILPRIGFKGAEARDWLLSQELELPATANSAVQNGLLLTCRLSETEFFIAGLSSDAEEQIQTLHESWSLDSQQRCYLLERGDSHACFAVSGDHVSEMMAKLCAIDLRAKSFAPYSIAQTSVAKINAIVVRISIDPEPRFLIFADMSSAEYLWSCLLDAMSEFSGTAMAYSDYLKRIK